MYSADPNRLAQTRRVLVAYRDHDDLLLFFFVSLTIYMVLEFISWHAGASSGVAERSRAWGNQEPNS